MKDSGVADVTGTILLVAITVGMSLGLSALVRGHLVAVDPPTSQLDLTLQRGPDGAWNTADDMVQVRHAGGEPVPVGDLRLSLVVDGATTQHAPPRAGALADGKLSIGERWNVTRPLPTTVTIGAMVIQEGASGGRIAARLERAGGASP